MSRAPQRLPAIDALERGIANVRANPELLIVQLLSSALIAASILVPIFVIMSRIGLPLSLFTANDAEAVRTAIEGISLDLPSALHLLGVTLVISAIGGTLVFLLYCFLQAGTLAVLSIGDAQAPPVRRLPVEVFRIFSWRGFIEWSGRFGWRLFWLLNLYLVAFTLLLFVLVLLILLSATAFGEENLAAACAVGCGIALPFLFLSFVLWIGVQMSSAVLVVEDCGVSRSFRHGLRLTSRRFGGVLLLLLLFLAASVVVSFFFGAIGFGIELAFSTPSVLRSSVSGGLAVLQFLASTVLSLVFFGAFIAMARGEHRLGSTAG